MQQTAPEISPIDDRSIDSVTALAYATTNVPMAYPDETVADILRQLGQAHRYDSMVDVAVVEAGRLVGIIPIEFLFEASLDSPASTLMISDPPVIGPGADRETTAARAVDHENISLGVVDINGVFLGLIPPRGLDPLRHEGLSPLARSQTHGLGLGS